MLLAALLFHFLVPHESNNHRARLLHPIFVTLSLFLFLLTQFLLPFLPQFTPVVLGYSSNISPEAIIQLTNAEREKTGSPPLRIEPLLTQAALAKGSDMLTRNYWAHAAPDGTQPWYFFVNADYHYRFAGENLARDFTNPEDAVQAWIASPTHRENLLAARYEDIGVAVVEGELDGVRTTLVVQLFGTRFTTATAATGEITATESAIATAATGPPESLQAAGPVGSLGQVSSTITGEEELARKILISPFSSTKRAALFFVSLFFTLLSIDMFVIHHKKVARHASKSFAHMLFFGMILVVVWFARSGSIL